MNTHTSGDIDVRPRRPRTALAPLEQRPGLSKPRPSCRSPALHWLHRSSIMGLSPLATPSGPETRAGRHRSAGCATTSRVLLPTSGSLLREVVFPLGVGWPGLVTNGCTMCSWSLSLHRISRYSRTISSEGHGVPHRNCHTQEARYAAVGRIPPSV